MAFYKEIKFSSKKWCTDWIFNDYKIHKLATYLSITAIKLFISIIILVLPITDIFRYDLAVNMCTFVKLEEKPYF